MPTSQHSSPSTAPGLTASRPWMQHHLPWLYAFWKFSRPHTIIGTSLSVVSLYGMAIAAGSVSEIAIPSITRLLAAWLTCLCGNVYIVGLNQLYDVDIDRMNKPHLPLASGEFSPRVGWSVVLAMGILALVTALLQGPALMWTVWLSLAIGTAYSLPPIRLKRFSFWASVCIFTVRGVIVNIGLFLHFQQVIEQQVIEQQVFNQRDVVTPEVWALTAFVLVFTLAIAL